MSVNDVILAAWVLGWPVAARIMYRKMDEGDDSLGTEDRLAAGFLALFWPFGLAILAIVGVFMLPTVRYTTLAERRRREREATEATQREREKLLGTIADLERQLGIGKPS